MRPNKSNDNYIPYHPIWEGALEAREDLIRLFKYYKVKDWKQSEPYETHVIWKQSVKAYTLTIELTSELYLSIGMQLLENKNKTQEEIYNSIMHKIDYGLTQILEREDLNLELYLDLGGIQNDIRAIFN